MKSPVIKPLLSVIKLVEYLFCSASGWALQLETQDHAKIHHCERQCVDEVTKTRERKWTLSYLPKHSIPRRFSPQPRRSEVGY